MPLVREKVSRRGWVTLEVGGGSASLREHPWVQDVEPVLAARFHRRACDLNLQGVNLNDPLFSAQWFYRNGEPFNLNIQPVWLNRAPANSPLAALAGRPGPFLARPYGGDGVVIGIADDAVQWRHEDLRSNFASIYNEDFVDPNDDDPSPSDNSEPHGTWIAGLAGAVGGNGKGIVGAAPGAELAGLRFFAATEENIDVLIDVFDHRPNNIDILNNSWGTAAYFPISQAILDELEDQVADRDRIFVFSVGDNRTTNELSSYQRLHDSRFTINVGAINSNGVATSESTGGSSVFIAGLSGDHLTRSIVTTELNDAYVTTGVGGTSFAAPQISGIVALMLQARPDLGWRDVQAIFRDPYLPEDGIDPPTHNYFTGYGLADAALAVRKAEVTPLLPAGNSQKYKCATRSRTGRNLQVSTSDLNVAADHDEWEAFFFDFTNRPNPNLLVEHVELTVEWDEGSTPLPADIEITSPARYYDDDYSNGDAFRGRFSGDEGSASIVSYAPFDDDDDVYPVPENWTFTSVRHWGENSTRGVMRGVWRVRIRLRHFDDSLPDSRRLDRLELKLWGSDNNAPPSVANADIAGSFEPALVNPDTVEDGEDILLTNIILRDTDYESNDFTYQWQILDEASGAWTDIAGQGGTVTGVCDYEGPKADFDVSRYPARTNLAMTFRDLSTAACGTSVVSWDWDFGDGTTSSLQNPAHTFATEGDKNVSLTVTDDQGRTGIFGKQLRVLAVSEDIPASLDEFPYNEDPPGLNTWTGTLTLPAAMTQTGTSYRCRITPSDALRDGRRFFTHPVSVSVPPPGVVAYGDPFQYGADIPIPTTPPATVPPFVMINEFSQGALATPANAEWVELLTTVETDLRNYKLSNSIVTFDVEFSQHDLWGAVPAGTLLVIYNGEFRDSQLPPDDLDLTDGVVVIPAQNTDYFLLPPNGDGWGEFPNFDPTHVAVLDRFCVPLHGVSWNEGSSFEPVLNEDANGSIAFRISQQEGAHADTASLLDYFEPANWRVTPAFVNIADVNLGVSPGLANSPNNQAAIQSAINAGLTSIPRYAYSPLIPGLSIDPDTGVLSGTPNVPDGGLFELTITRSHSWNSASQVIVLTLLPLPDDDDRDHDGVVALAERAMGMDSLAPDADKLPTTTIVSEGGDDFLGFHYQRVRGGFVDPTTGAYVINPVSGEIHTEVWTSSDLKNWTNATAGGSIVVTSAVPDPLNPAVELVNARLTDPLSSMNYPLYLQLRFTRVPLP